MTYEQVRQLAQTLADAGLPVSANKIVAHLGGSKRDALRLLRVLRAEVPPPVPGPPPPAQGTHMVTDTAAAAGPPVPPAPHGMGERPLVLCYLCGYSQWREHAPGLWVCGLCGVPPATGQKGARDG
jgi:hypothetical protein